ncbi:hypothetical protein PRUB_b0694 [Pseudoalteromonas rubra]|uniref:Uncharacterized protein n=1 Tax=Pseudoalteromonas rubra TaxID=43658 RepID=A0A8T0C0N2_9GAMM|nr:hypothetical protein PRUB_b0694 [Pseudoalteromonas rubra]
MTLRAMPGFMLLWQQPHILNDHTAFAVGTSLHWMHVL